LSHARTQAATASTQRPISLAPYGCLGRDSDGFVASLYQIHRQDPNNEMPLVFHLGMRATYSLAGAAIGLVVGLVMELTESIWRR